MVRQRKLKLVYYLILTAILMLVGVQIYINVSEPDFDSVHAEQVASIQGDLDRDDPFQFVVVGNVNNSIRLFRDQIIPKINNTDVKFVVSAGNLVSGGQEESYRSAYGIMEQLNKPYLLTYGDNEDSDFGSYRFYSHFGPHFYSFQAGNSHFIFLDLTGKTPLDWQVDWLRRELAGSESRFRFVFTGIPLIAPEEEVPVMESENMADPEVRDALRPVLEAYGVDAVFAANMSVFDEQEHNSVRYFITGGAGGLIFDDDNSFHHYLTVDVGDDLTISPRPVEVGQSRWLNTLDSLWSAIYTFFYVSYVRFFLALGVLLFLGLRLHEILFVEKNYYAQFEMDYTAEIRQPKTIAFFSNNYFPFVSGVTISIDRLARGLSSLGHQVSLVVPRYDTEGDDDDAIVRVRTLMAFGNHREFRLANLLQISVWRAVARWRPDIIHVHHPFWLGSLGLFLGRRLRIPVIYTYHTRLEQYAHYVPLPGPIFRNVISHYLVKRFCNKCNGVVVPTFSVEEYLRAIGVRTPILVQPTGIEFDRFQHRDESVIAQIHQRFQIEQGEKVLVSVSRLGKEKNIDFLIDAAQAIREKAHARWKFLIIGQGDEGERLQARITEMGLQDHVFLVGAVPPDEMSQYYHAADVFGFASKSETQGMVLLEAMSVGLPVVAVRSSGIDDVIEDGEFGYKTGEVLADWSKRVVQLLDDDDLRAEFSEKARVFARGHDVSHFCANINQFYARVMAEQRS